MAAWRTRLIMTAALLTAASPLPMATRAAPSLDYEFFKTRVQPVFLQKRDGHTRCYVCHAESNNAFRLERLAPGASAWSEEQSRKNFEMAAILVNPGDPGDQPAVAAAAGARGRRQRLPFRRPAVRVQGRPELEDPGGLGQRAETVVPHRPGASGAKREMAPSCRR